MQKHKLCFHAVVVITQLKFQSGATVFADELEITMFIISRDPQQNTVHSL